LQIDERCSSVRKTPNVWDLSAEQSLQITKQDQSATGGFSEISNSKTCQEHLQIDERCSSVRKTPNVWDLSAEQCLQITKQDQSATGGFSELFNSKTCQEHLQIDEWCSSVRKSSVTQRSDQHRAAFCDE